MGLFRTIVWGREDGIRSKVREALTGGAHDTSPDSAYSAPTYGSPEPNAGYGGGTIEPPRDVTPPEGFEVVMHVDALKPGEVAEVIAGGTAICMANVDGEFFAVSNTCPPGDSPLGEGTLSGKFVTCPYHGWVFDVTTGECQTNPDAAVESYPVQVKGPAVCVRM